MPLCLKYKPKRGFGGQKTNQKEKLSTVNIGLRLCEAIKIVDSCLNLPYTAAIWKNGEVMHFFHALKNKLSSPAIFQALCPERTFKNDYGQGLGGFITLCRALYPHLNIKENATSFASISSNSLAYKIASHSSILLEFDICHLFYDILHFQALFAGQATKYQFATEQCSLIDIVEKALEHMQVLEPSNAVSAQQLYLRIYALTDLLQDKN
ncbi:MAG TPA: hypothetical protein VIH61_01165 [Waddliaceae bacterium]